MQGDAWSKNKFMLKPGQWTDDGSMALCLCDTLLVHGALSDEALCDLRLRFLCWWELGLNCSFCYDEERRGFGAVGLGGNISMSFGDFLRKKQPATSAGDHNVSGNGSVMRNSPVCARFHNDTEEAMKNAELQSRTTHQGTEAAECCRLMALICTRAMQVRGKRNNDTFIFKKQKKRTVLLMEGLILIKFFLNLKVKFMPCNAWQTV